MTGKSPSSSAILAAAPWAGLWGFPERVAGLMGWRRALCAFAAGAVGALALAPVNMVAAFVLSFSVLVWLIDGTYEVKNSVDGQKISRIALRHAAAIGWWFGFGFFLAGLYWIGFAFLVEAETYAWLIPFVVLLMPGGLAIFTALAAAAARTFWRPGAARLVALALTWSIAEWLRGHILTGFPWNLTGYTWSEILPVSQSAALFGIYGLSLLTVLACLSPAALGPAPMRSKRALLWPGAAILGVACIWAAGSWRLSQTPTSFVEGVQLRLVQPSIAQADKWRPGNGRNVIDTYIALSTKPGYETVSHLIWPESALPYALSREPRLLDELGDMLGPDRTALIGSVRIEVGNPGERGLVFNALHVVQGAEPEARAAGLIAATYDKFHLVPFGEYLPLADWLEPLGLTQLVAGSFAAGPGLKTVTVAGAPAVSPLICYEVIFPGRVIEPGSRPGWLVNLTNDAWFGDSSGPRQHLQMARLRAVESGLPLVRSANNGISAIIDPLGRVLGALPLNVSDVLDGGLPEALEPTPYARFGDWFYFGMLGVLGVWSTLGPRRLSSNKGP